MAGSACGVADASSRAAFVSECADVFSGSVNILVSNVGFNIRKPTVEVTIEQYRALMTTNLEASFALCQAFHPLLRAARAPPSCSTAPSRPWSPCRAARCTP